MLHDTLSSYRARVGRVQGFTKRIGTNISTGYSTPFGGASAMPLVIRIKVQCLFIGIRYESVITEFAPNYLMSLISSFELLRFFCFCLFF